MVLSVDSSRRTSGCFSHWSRIRSFFSLLLSLCVHTHTHSACFLSREVQRRYRKTITKLFDIDGAYNVSAVRAFLEGEVKKRSYSLLSDSLYDDVVAMLMPQNKRRVTRQRANIWDSAWGRCFETLKFQNQLL